jgi:hypothetical protein
MPATQKPSTLESDVDCNGTQELVESEQHTDEDFGEFAARHKQAVAAAVAACGESSSVGLSGFLTPVVCESVTTDVLTQQVEGQAWRAFLDHHYAAVRVKTSACA